MRLRELLRSASRTCRQQGRPLVPILMSLLIVVAWAGSASAGVQQLLTATDSSADADMCAAPVEVTMVTVTTNAFQGGNDATTTRVTVGGTVAAADIDAISAYYAGLFVSSVTNPGSLTDVDISLLGNQKGNSDWVYTVTLNSGASGKTFNMTVTSITGTDNAVLPFTTATRTAVPCATNAVTTWINVSPFL